jgi:anti-sigma regulatory factor (Ser/Thr protein kinase)
MTGHPSCLAGSLADGTDGHWLAPVVEMAAVASGSWPLSPEPHPMSWTCFPRVATRTPGVDARSVRAARDFAVATVERWGIAQRCEDIAIVVSELLTNALRHALPESGETWPRSPIRLGLLQPGPSVLCAVADPGRGAPVPKHPGLLAETGRGLHVIDALADAWGYTTPGDTGKVVWAMFSAGRPSAHASLRYCGCSPRVPPTGTSARPSTSAVAPPSTMSSTSSPNSQ